MRQPRLETQQDEQPLVRRGPTEGVLDRERLGAVGRECLRRRFLQRVVLAQPSPAQLVEREVGGGAVQPRGALLAREVGRGAASDAQERLLGEVLGCLARADHALDPAPDRRCLFVV